MTEPKTKEVWVLRIQNPDNSADVATEVYDDFDLFMERSIQLHDKWGVSAEGRSVLVNTVYY
jgi:hypothetical protein